MSKLEKGYGSAGTQAILGDIKTYFEGKLAQKANTSDIPVVTGKADKVTNATSGHLAGLDSNGNLTDSGVSPTEDVTVEGNPVTFESPFEQDAKSVVVSVKPIQDLHGYDHPWAGGAGKNKLPLTVAKIKELNTTGTWDGNVYTRGGVAYNVKTDDAGNVTAIETSGTASENTALDIYRPFTATADTYTLNGCPANGSSSTYYMAFGGDVDTGSGVALTAQTNTIYIFVTSGQNMTGKVFYPMIRLATESDATFAPYSNICPISGIDEVEIGVSGRNIWNERLELGSINSNGENAPSSSELRSTDYIRVKPNTDYYFYEGFSPAYHDVYFYDENKSFISQDPTDVTAFTTPLNAHFIRFRLHSGYGTTYRNDICINVSDASFNGHYESYNPNSHTTTIPLPSTLYDADVDVTEGDATEPLKMVDLGTLNWHYDEPNRRFYTDTIPDAYLNANNESRTGFCICSDYKTFWHHETYDENWDGVAYVAWWEHNPLHVFMVHDHRYTDAATFKNAVSGVQFLYQVTTPTTISFTPADVELLEGTNVVSTNGEKVAVTYKAGILATLGDIDDLNDKVKTKFDKKDVAKVEGTNASKPYAVGDYMLRSDGFYVVTQAIAQNAPITSNNTDKTTVGNELSNKADSDIDGDMRPITSNAVHDIKQSLLNKIPDYPIEWFDFTQDIVYNENITFGTEYTFTIPTTSSSYYYLQNSKLLWMAYKLPSDQQDNRGRSNYAVVNVWGGTDSRNFVMATFFDIDDDGNMFYVKIYDYHYETNQFKLKADYVNGYIPSSPMSLLINYIRQSPERWR